MQIRQAETRDLPAMTALLEELFSIEADFTFNKVRQEAGLRMVLESPVASLLVAEQDGQVIGMISLQLVISSAEGGWSLQVEDLVVQAAHRRQNVGGALLQAAGEWGSSRGAGRLQLLADCDNAKALAFYRA